MKRTYYAAQRPRGFLNETIVHRFDDTASRDAWIEQATDAAENSACGAYKITAKRARYLVRADDWRDAEYLDQDYVYTRRY